MARAKDEKFVVTVKGWDIIVAYPREKFRAIYYKAAGHPQLILRERTKCDDFELLSEAWTAANDKARESGWIV